jgi:hypothetical protein
MSGLVRQDGIIFPKMHKIRKGNLTRRLSFTEFGRHASKTTMIQTEKSNRKE